MRYILLSLIFVAGISLSASAQFIGNLWGQATVGDPVSFIKGDIINKSSGELFLGSHSPVGLQINKLNINGNYVGTRGSKVYTSVIDNSNTDGTRGYIDITGTATKADSNDATSVMLDFGGEWDGSCIDLIRALDSGSDAETFGMDETVLGDRVAILRNRLEDNSRIWYLAEKLNLSHLAPNITRCLSDTSGIGSFQIVVNKEEEYNYQWHSYDSNRTNHIHLGAENGAQTREYFPPSDQAGIYYYYCVVSSKKCGHNSDTVHLSGRVHVKPDAKIAEHPLDYFICDSTGGQSIVLDVKMEDDNGVIYQWYKNGEAIDGENFSELEVEPSKDGMDKYYVEAYGCDTVQSQIVEVGYSLDIILQKMNSTLVISNNPKVNGGYSFVHYTWYKNGEKISEGSHDNLFGHYYANGDLDPYAEYWAEMIDVNGDHYRTCVYTPIIKTKLELIAYPNPALASERNSVTVKITGVAFEELADATIEVYNTLGVYVGKEEVQGRASIPVRLPNAAGAYILQFKSKTLERNIKVIVK